MIVQPNESDEARQPETPPTRLRELAQQPDLAPLVAANPVAPADVLRELGTSRDPAVLAAVCANPNTPIETLLVLAGEYPAQFCANPVFPLLLLEYPNFPNEMPADALLHVLRYDAVPASFLAWLRTYGSPAVIEAAQLHVNTLGDVADWAECAAVALRNTPFPGYHDSLRELESLGAIPDLLAPLLVVHAAELAAPDESYHTPLAPPTSVIMLDLDHLDAAADADDVAVREAVARHPATPVALLHRLEFDDATRVRQAVAANPNTPSEMLHRLMIDGIHTRLIVAHNPNTAPNTLLRLAADSYAPIRRAVIEHPNASAAVRDQVLIHLLLMCAGSDEPLYRLLVHAHPQTPLRYLEAGVAAADWRCRYALTHNPAVSRAILVMLSRDGNALVRAAARAASAQRPSEIVAEPRRIAEPPSPLDAERTPENDVMLDFIRAATPAEWCKRAE